MSFQLKSIIKAAFAARAVLFGFGLAALLALCLFLAPRLTGMGHNPSRISAKIGLINYSRDDYLSVFVNGKSAGGVTPLAYVSGACCLSLPTQWKPGMKMNVSWLSGSMYRASKDFPPAEREVDVQPYEPFSEGYVWIVLLPGDAIRIQPSPDLPGSAGLPSLPKPSEASWDYISQLTRKSTVMPESIGARLGIANYVDDELATVFVDKEWAGNVGALAYTMGAGAVCLPTHWKPGMKMLVSWVSASMRVGDEHPRMAEREVDVLPYEPFSSGYVWAVFLPGGVIRLQPADAGPGTPGFLQGLPRPRVATQAQIEQIIHDTEPKH